MPPMKGRPEVRPYIRRGRSLDRPQTLEVDLRSYLEITRLQDQRWLLPAVVRAVRAEPRRDRLPVVRVEQVVDVQRQADAPLARCGQRLAEAQVELLAVAAEQRERLEQVDRCRSGGARR